MANRASRWQTGHDVPKATTDEGDADAEIQHVRNYVYNPGTLSWDRMTASTGGGGGGGAATIADGADVAQGAQADAAWGGSGAGSVVAILKALYAKLAGTLTVSVSGTPTINQGTGGASAWKVDGSGVTQPVSGTFWQATQPVSGPLTDTQLRATRVPVDGSGVTQPVSGTFWQATQPVSIAAQTPVRTATGAIDLAGTALTPKFAKITASASGDTTVVSAVASKKIRVLRWDLVCNAAVNAKWKSATTGDISGIYYFGANGGISSAEAALGHFETVAGEALAINLASAVAVGGSLTYVEV